MVLRITWCQELRNLIIVFYHKIWCIQHKTIKKFINLIFFQYEFVFVFVHVCLRTPTDTLPCMISWLISFDSRMIIRTMPKHVPVLASHTPLRYSYDFIGWGHTFRHSRLCPYYSLLTKSSVISKGLLLYNTLGHKTETFLHHMFTHTHTNYYWLYKIIPYGLDRTFNRALWS
jgi:hypothetical protein